MDIKINTDRDKVYKQYLSLLNPVLGPNKLDPTEIEVLSNILYIDWLYKHLSKEQRDKIIFNPVTKAKITTLLGISKAQFNNNMLRLRRKKFITKKSLILKVEEIDNKLTINYTLEIGRR